MKQMLKNYKCLAYVDTGSEDQERYMRFAKKAAERLHLGYQDIRGSNQFIKKILNGPWDDEFIVAPPGHIISLDDFEMCLNKGKSRSLLLTENEL